ncbi:hypothetical protein [Rubripirellula tenax]|uniref:hypothetical protein n=1 Tax=Rubripirellula tenax TaxID=2528015 RepID=UPI0011B7609B|nr:hypothetical protein [Rubripirellula tenax]
MMPDQQVAQIDGLVGRRVDGIVRIVDEKRRTVVVTPTRFHEFPPAKPTHSYLTDEYLLLLVDNLRPHVDPDDNERYLGDESARNILVAIFDHDAGSDPDAWQQYISERRPTWFLR